MTRREGVAVILKIKPYRCKRCHVNLRGKKIPKKDQLVYGADHFGREVGSYSLYEDKTIYFSCPDCNFQWKR